MKRTVLILVLICCLVSVCCISSAENEAPPQPELQLQPAELHLNKGSGAKVTPTVTNLPKGVRTKKFEWSTSDPEVATVSGNVRGVGAGQAVITCTAILTDGTELSADCPVTVTVPVSRIHQDRSRYPSYHGRCEDRRICAGNQHRRKSHPRSLRRG